MQAGGLKLLAGQDGVAGGHLVLGQSGLQGRGIKVAQSPSRRVRFGRYMPRVPWVVPTTTVSPSSVA